MRSRSSHRFNLSAEGSIGLLFGLTSLTAALLILAAVRLLAGAGGELTAQHGLHWMAESCMLMLTAADPADRLLAYAMIALPLSMLTVAAWQTLGQMRATKQTVNRLKRAAKPLPARVLQAATKAGLPARVVLVESDTALAFCAGLLRGRVYITTSLVAMLGEDDALVAVLLHERYHLRHRDPLLMLFARAAVGAFFFIPLVGELYRHYLAMRELAADAAATTTQGRPEPLAAALYRLATIGQAAGGPLAIARMIDGAGGGVLNARLDALLGVAAPYTFRLRQRKLWLSLAALGITALLLTMTYAAHGGLVLATIAHWLEGFC